LIWQFEYGFAGTRFQKAGRAIKEKDVVSEHEDKTNSSCYHNCHHSHSCSCCYIIQIVELFYLGCYLVSEWCTIYMGLLCW